MSNNVDKHICPVEYAGVLQSRFRKFIQNPRRILKKYIKPDMSILDFGCGPGLFSIEMTKMLDGTGKVIAADFQDEMLQIVSKKIQGTDLENNIILHKTKKESIGIDIKFDFILAFYVIHEVPDRQELFKEIISILNPDGNLLIVEPIFHVSKSSFKIMEQELKDLGYHTIARPRISLSRAILLSC